MLLAEVFNKNLIKLDLESRDKDAVFDELVGEILAVKPELDGEEILAAIHDRELKMVTSVAPGVAVPHGYFRGLNGIIGALGFSRRGIEYGSRDNKPVHLVFMVLLGEGARERHLHVLSRILTFVKSGALSYIGEAESPQKAYDILCQAG
ncbi:MAG: PTS sugar transporter subunit IIA [Treponema sp.]|jgi:mannitol/fructose-specific phosphotransferase system IIA component (Ntr-type)|nr:PTS sugar transporter subunit IIA [Treponema sp.]